MTRGAFWFCPYTWVFTSELDARLRAAGSRVKAVAAAPGLAATNMQVTAFRYTSQYDVTPLGPSKGRYSDPRIYQSTDCKSTLGF
jgi:hypothetical protein